MNVSRLQRLLPMVRPRPRWFHPTHPLLSYNNMRFSGSVNFKIAACFCSSTGNIDKAAAAVTQSKVYQSEYKYKLRIPDGNTDIVVKDILQQLDKGIDEFCSSRHDCRKTLDSLSKLKFLGGFPKVAYGLSIFFSPESDSKEVLYERILNEVESYSGEIEECNLHHKHALLALCRGDLAFACSIWEDSLLRNPKDILALRCIQQTYEKLGDTGNMLATVQRVLPMWDSTDPGYSRVIAMHAYGLQANDLITEAEETVGRSLNISLDNMLAIDAMAQAYERTSRHREGLRLLNELSDTWRGNTILENQLHWYRALFQAQVGEYGISLLVVDNDMSEEAFIERTSVLWRLKLYGLRDEDIPKISLGLPTGDSETYSQPSFLSKLFSSEPSSNSGDEGILEAPTLTMRFAQVVDSLEKRDVYLSPLGIIHRAMAMAGARRDDDLCEFILALEEFTEEKDASDSSSEDAPHFSTNRMLCLADATFSLTHKEKIAQFVLPACKSIRLYGLGRYSEAVQLMLPLKNSWYRIGAASAHIDTLEQTFLHSLARAAGVSLDDGHELQTRSDSELYYLALARALLSQRVYQRKLCPQSYLLYAKVLFDTGSHKNADAAYRRSLDLGMGQGGNNAA